MRHRSWIIAGLLSLVGSAGWRYARESTIPVAPLSTLSPLDVAVSDSLPTVVVAFRLNDCSGNIEALRAWNVMHRGATAAVVGVVLTADDDSSGVAAVIGGSGIKYPVYQDRSGDVARLAAVLGVTSTPLAVVFDRTGAVRRIVPLAEGFAAHDREAVYADIASLRTTTP